MLGPKFGVTDSKSCLRCQTKYADLALVKVAMNFICGRTGIFETKCLRKCGVDHSAGDHPIGFVSLTVISEVATDNSLKVHPQIAVVVFMHISRGRRAGHDSAAFSSHIDTGAEGFTAGMLKDDIDVVATG